MSLLPVFSKIVEKGLQKRLISFLSKYSVINNAQFGYQAKKNTIDAVSEVVETIRISLCSKEKYYGVFIDLSKAFVTVSHEILLPKCFADGLRGKIYDILNSYLTNRQQCISIKKQQSSFGSIFCGVPQVSVLGPLLFLIYVNDLPAFCTNCNVTMFADDTNIYGKVDDGINDTIENVSVWMESNKLATNRDKCKAISFVATNETPEIKIYDYSIEFVDHIKYLGVYIDSKLSFKSHIEKIISRMNSLTAAIYQYKIFFKRHILVRLYKIYVQPVLQYGVLLYGVANKSDLQKLEWLQSRIFRLLFSAKRFQSIDELRCKHMLFSVKELHIYELIKLLSRILRH